MGGKLDYMQLCGIKMSQRTFRLESLTKKTPQVCESNIDTLLPIQSPYHATTPALKLHPPSPPFNKRPQVSLASLAT